MFAANLKRLVLGSLLCPSLLACAAELEGDPADYIVGRQTGGAAGAQGSGGKGGASSTGGQSGGGAGGSSGPCDAVPIFNKSCAVSFCHSTSDKAGGLDLASPDLASRLVDVAAAGSDCTDLKLIDSASPDDSLLIDKLSNNKPACGERMPYGAEPLSADNLACVKSWVEGLVSGGGSTDPDAGN